MARFEYNRHDIDHDRAVPMSRKCQNSSNGEAYLKLYSTLGKWIHVCASCGVRGYKPDVPDQIGEGIAAKNIHRFFQPLSLDESGRCSQCAAVEQAGNV